MPTEARQQVIQAAGLKKPQATKALATNSIEEMPAAIADKLAPVLSSAAGSQAQQAQAATEDVAKKPVDSLFNGKPDANNSAALDELEGFKAGDSVDVSGRTIGRSTIEAVYRRQMAGFGMVPMARVVGANGKKLGQ
jgi:hypothetical protein